MMHLRSVTGMVVGILLAALAACCPIQQVSSVRFDPSQWPAPISQEEQVRRLSEWSHQFPRIRATTVLGGVGLQYRDDKGQQRTQNAEGTLLIRQHFTEASGSPPATQNGGDVLLVGKAFNQQVFQAGKNAAIWWFIMWLDTKAAWTGDAHRAVDFSRLGSSQTGILRADLVLDLLALSDLPQPEVASGSTNEQSLMMRVNDFAGTNDLWISRPALGGQPRLTREIIVDRKTGDVQEVRMYDAGGVMVVRSQLSDYGMVTSAESPNQSGPRFPRKVTVDCPAPHLTISLEFEKVGVPATLPDTAFETPDFQDQGLKVFRVE